MEIKWVDTQNQLQTTNILERIEKMGKTNASIPKNVFSFAKVGMVQQQALMN